MLPVLTDQCYKRLIFTENQLYLSVSNKSVAIKKITTLLLCCLIIFSARAQDVKRFFEKKYIAKAVAPKKAEVLDVINTIAAAKVIAWWGVDYILLAKQNDKWMIDQVLW